MASQTSAAAERGHRLFTIPSKHSNLIKSPKSLNTLNMNGYTCTVRLQLSRQEEENNEAVPSTVWLGPLHQICPRARHRNTRWKVFKDDVKYFYWSEHGFAFMNYTLNDCLLMSLSGPAALTNSWQVSSLNETVMNQILQLKSLELVRLNQRQLLRVYPSNYRVDSSNFNPQPYWNAGCHMGESVLDYHTADTETTKMFVIVAAVHYCTLFLPSCNELSNGGPHAWTEPS